MHHALAALHMGFAGEALPPLTRDFESGGGRRAGVCLPWATSLLAVQLHCAVGVLCLAQIVLLYHPATSPNAGAVRIAASPRAARPNGSGAQLRAAVEENATTGGRPTNRPPNRAADGWKTRQAERRRRVSCGAVLGRSGAETWG